MPSKTSATFLIAIMLALAFAIRSPTIWRTTGAPNIEASYHVMLTVQALRESPVTSHWLLPTVTLGRPNDKFIPWGASIPTASGDYIYTSFPPPGFLAPFIFFKVFQIENTLTSLMIFNFSIEILCSFALYYLLIRVLESQKISGGHARMAAILGTSLQIFSSESMLSFGLVYWSQQLFQFLYILALIFLCRVLQKDGRSSHWLGMALAVTTAVGPWTEWTGFVFNGGIALLLLIRSRRDKQYVWIFMAILCSTLLASLAIVTHYALVTGFDPSITAFADRFSARTVQAGSIQALVRGYVASYGLFLPLVLILFIAILVYFRSGFRPYLYNTSLSILFVSCFALFENIVMLQHATQFSFDRLKAVVPFAIVVSLGFSIISRNSALLCAVFLLAGVIQNQTTYQRTLNRFKDWAMIDRDNSLLVKEVSKVTDISCATLGSNLAVRGYASLLLHRSIIENVTRDRFEQSFAANSSAQCDAIYLHGSSPYIDLPKYDEATIYKAGSVIHIRSPSSDRQAHSTSASPAP